MESGGSTSTGNNANNAANEFGSRKGAGSIILRSKNIDSNKNVIISAHDTINTGYKITLPQSIGTADEVLKISSVSGTNAVCEWGDGGGGGGTSLPSQTGNADKFLKTDGSSLTGQHLGGSVSSDSSIYAHLQPESRNVDNSISDNEVVYLAIDNSKAPEGLSSYSVGNITLTTDRKGIKLPSNGDYKMDFNINVRKNGNPTEFVGELYQGNTMIQNSRTHIRQVDQNTYRYSGVDSHCQSRRSSEQGLQI